jgi:hypothetical protein
MHVHPVFALVAAGLGILWGAIYLGYINESIIPNPIIGAASFILLVVSLSGGRHTA